MSYLLTRKTNGQVVMVSETEPKYDKTKFDLIECALTDEQRGGLDGGAIPFHRNGKFEIEKPAHKIRKEKLLNDIENAKDLSGIKKLLKQLI